MAKPTTSSPRATTPPLKAQPATPRQPHTFNLGDVLRCRITGFTGVAVAFTEYLYGCRRWSLLPTQKPSEKHDWQTFDEPQMERVAAAKAPAAPAAVTGGPRPDAAGRPSPAQR